MCAQNARSSKNILFLSGLYRRYGNRTRSEAAAFRRLYCRWGIAPRPKESFFCFLFVILYLLLFIDRPLLYAPPAKLSTVLRKKVGEAKKGSRRAARQKKTTALFRRTPRTPSASLCTRNDLDMQRGRRIAPPAKIFLFSALYRAARKAADVHPHFL